MSTAGSQEFYDRLPPDVAKAVLEGKPLLIHAVKVSIVREGAGKMAYAIDTLPSEGRPKEWVRTTNRICSIVKAEIGKVPTPNMAILAVIGDLMPEQETPIIKIDTWLSMKDDGGSWWEVTGVADLMVISLPDLRKAVERMKKKVLREVCRI